jgi:hypothetical protein
VLSAESSTAGAGAESAPRESGSSVARFVRQVLRPHWMIVVPLSLSFLAWVAPWSPNVDRGFGNPVALTLRAGLVLTLWYGLAFATAWLGFFLGRRVAPARVLDEFPRETAYRYFTAVATLGVGYAYGKVVVEDPGLIWRSLRTRTFSEVRYALDYSAGVQTLRYATILAGGIALYELFFRGRLRWVHVFNLVLLIAASALSSRLSLAMAFLVALGLFAYRSRTKRVSVVGIAALLALVFGGFVVFNDIRNGGLYQRKYHVSNPFLSNLYQAVSYLGAPFQASVAVAGHGDAWFFENPYVPNGGAERGRSRWAAYATGPGPNATLARTSTPRYVASGRWAFMAKLDNPWKGGSRSLYVYSTLPVRVAEGESWYLSATVTGTADAERPIALGTRWSDGHISQDFLTPTGNGPTLRSRGSKRQISAVFTTPRGVAWIEPAVWKQNIQPGTTSAFAVDDVVLWRVGPRGVQRGISRPPFVRALASYVVPTYVKQDFPDVTNVQNLYRSSTGIANWLTTNSVFASMKLALGWPAFPLVALIGLFGGALAGHASRYRSHFLLVTVVIAYCFSELWRVYLFNAGIVHFLLLLLVAVPFAHLALMRLRRRIR